MSKTFYTVLANSLTASLTNTFVWFAATFWAYLATESVIVTSVMAGIYLVTIAGSGFFLGSIVDRYKKKQAMLISTIASFIFYIVAILIYVASPAEAFTYAASPILWVFLTLLLFGAIVGNMRAIALSTLVTVLVHEDQRDRANGMVGTANGVGFLLASIFSGLAIGFLGVFWMLFIAIVTMALVILHLLTIKIPEGRNTLGEEASAEQTADPHAKTDHIDIWGTIRAIQLVPGLFGLLFFNMFNNFLGGIFMSLMDAYGLELISVQAWGILWGFLSLGFIVGGIAVARFGLGKNPLRTLFQANIVMWFVSIIFVIQPSIILLTIGMFVWLCLGPVAEAAEQTILQRVIPLERQGRVFGFAQSIEQAASPLTAFFIGPIAEFIFIPYMTNGAGVDLIGTWFGVGKDRGIALLFIVAGIVGLVVTLSAMRSRSYRTLSHNYQRLGTELVASEALSS